MIKRLNFNFNLLVTWYIDFFWQPLVEENWTTEITMETRDLILLVHFWLSCSEGALI